MPDIARDHIMQIDSLAGYRRPSVNDAPSVEIAGSGSLCWAHPDDVTAAPPTVAG